MTETTLPPGHPLTLTRSSWRDVKASLRRDKARLCEHYARYHLAAPHWLGFNPSYQCIWLHRVSHHCFRNGRRVLARLFWNINLVLTGADISPISQIGPGAVILHPTTTLIFGRVGADCLFWGHCGVGGGRSNDDIGAGAGFPIVGDRVSFGTRTIVLGPIQVGDDCVLGAGCIVMKDLPPRTCVELNSRQFTVRTAAP